MNPESSNTPRAERVLTAGEVLDAARSAVGVAPIVGVVVAVFGVLALSLSPHSPGGLMAGDLAQAVGRPDIAVARYDAVADRNPSQSLRQQALRRAAMVAQVHLGDSEQARLRFGRLAVSGLPPEEEARVLERIGALYDGADQPLNAARLYQRAHDAHPTAPQAGQRLQRAARILQDASLTERSLATWAALAKQHPEFRPHADIGRAEIHLAQGHEQRALGLFESGGRRGSAELRAVARLGAVACLERLGDLDEALAAIDDADLPAMVRATRSEVIQNRANRRDEHSSWR